MRKCRHPSTVFIHSLGEYGLTVRRMCMRCSEHVPLGPSNDTEAVQIEIRAAELAVTVTDPLWWSYYADRSETGYLANQIATHDDERSDR